MSIKWFIWLVLIVQRGFIIMRSPFFSTIFTIQTRQLAREGEHVFCEFNISSTFTLGFAGVTVLHIVQESFWAWSQSMRDDVTSRLHCNVVSHWPSPYPWLLSCYIGPCYKNTPPYLPLMCPCAYLGIGLMPVCNISAILLRLLC